MKSFSTQTSKLWRTLNIKHGIFMSSAVGYHLKFIETLWVISLKLWHIPLCSVQVQAMNRICLHVCKNLVLLMVFIQRDWDSKKKINYFICFLSYSKCNHQDRRNWGRKCHSNRYNMYELINIGNSAQLALHHETSHDDIMCLLFILNIHQRSQSKQRGAKI